MYKIVFMIFLVFGKAYAFKNEKLDSGLELITMESHKVPLVTIVLVFKAGGMTETKDIDGLTHFWEHMFFKGNKRLPNQEAFKKRVRQLGIVFNGDTSAEKVRYFFTLPSYYLDEGLQFMADAIATPLLEKNEIERERKVVLDEYDRSASRPGFKLHKLTQHIIYGNEAHRRDPLGLKRETLNTANKAQLIRIKNEVFVPQNAALIIGGDFDKVKIKEKVQKYFGFWKSPKDWKNPVHPKFQNFPKSQTLVATHPDVRNGSLTLTFLGPKVTESPKDTFVVDVLISLLSSRGSKFYRKFVESGLTYGAHFSYHTQSQAGELDLSVQAEPKNLLKIRKLLLAEAKLWGQAGYFNKQELVDVKRNLLIDYKRQLSKPSQYTKTLAFWWPVAGLDYYSNYLEGMRAVTFKDIRAFVKKYFIGRNHVDQILVNDNALDKLGLKENVSGLIKKNELPL